MSRRHYEPIQGLCCGLQQVSYENDEYRSTVRENGEVLFVSIFINSMRGAIRSAWDLAQHFERNRF